MNMCIRQSYHFNKRKKFLPVFFSGYEASDSVFKHIAESIMQESRTTEMKVLCKACALNSRLCKMCEYQNSTISVQEAKTLEIMAKNIYETIEDGKPVLEVRYVFRQDPHILYPPHLSNIKAATLNSLKLWERLKRKNQLQIFQDLIDKELSQGFAEKLTDEQIRQSAHLPVYFSSVNMSLNIQKQKYRFVNNHSFSQHKSGSINENSLLPPTLLSNPQQIMFNFFIKRHIFISDISAAFKMLRSCKISNNLRSFMWLRKYDPDQMNVTENDFTVYRPLRLSFGSTPASTFLDLARLNFISKKAKLPESQYIIDNLVFVDDLLGTSDSFERLEEIKNDIFAAFKYYQFEFKESFQSNQPGEPQVTSFLGNFWRLGLNGQVDEVKAKLFFSVHERKRNIQPPLLNENNLKDLVITRKVASRVIGTLFSYLTGDIQPIVTNAKLLYSRICRATKSWVAPIKSIDPELERDYRQFLSTLINLSENLRWFPRCAVPQGHKIIKVYIPQDASIEIMGSCLYIVTQHTETGVLESRLLTSKTKISRLTVVKAETSCFKLSVSLLNSFLCSLDLTDYNFDVYIFTDALACTNYFSFQHTHSCIISRNVTQITTKFMMDTIKKFPNIKSINLAWIRGSDNISDKVTRFSQDCLEITNSDEFRRGPAFFRNINYPSKKYIFMTISQQSPELSYTRLNVKDIEGANAGIDNGDRRLITPRKQQVVNAANNQVMHCFRVTTVKCCDLCKATWFRGAGHNFKCSKEGGPEVNQIRPFNKDFYTWIIKKYSSLRTLINVLFRMISFYDKKIRKSDVWLKVVYTSQQLYGNKKDYQKSCYDYATLDNGIVCMRTRSAVCKNENFVDNFLIPYLPRADKLLASLVISNAHIIKLTVPHISHIHKNSTLTKVNIQTNEDFACWIPKVGHYVKSFIGNCVSCNKSSPKFQLNPPGALRFFHSEKSIGLHSFSSFDLIGPVLLSNNLKDRKSYKFYCIFLECLVTKHVSFQLINDYSQAAVRVGLMTLQQRFSNFRYLLSDCGSQLRLDPQDKIFEKGVILDQLPASAQKLSVCEREYQSVKKLMKNLFNSREKLKFPKMSLLDFECCLSIISNVHNSRCLTVGRGPGPSLHISPNMLAKSYLGQAESDKNIMQILKEMEEENDSYFEIISKNRNFKTFLIEQLKILLVANNDTFLRKCPDFKFRPGDICWVRRGQSSFKLCEIISINESQTHAHIKLLNYGKPEIQPTITSILVFLHRENQEA